LEIGGLTVRVRVMVTVRVRVITPTLNFFLEEEAGVRVRGEIGVRMSN
jgi:hypothetical protein